MEKKKKTARDVPPDAERCTRNDGKSWRCSKPRAEEGTMCEYHMQYARAKIKKASAVKSKGKPRVTAPSSDRKDRRPWTRKDRESGSEEETDGDEDEELKKVTKRGKSLKKEALESDEDESSEGVLKVSLEKSFRRKRSLTKKVSGEERDLESSDGSGSQEEASVEKGYKDEIGKARRRRSAMKEVAKVYKRDFESEDESDGEPVQTNDDDFKLGEKRKMKGTDKAVKRARNSRNLIDYGGEPSSTAKGSNNKEVPEGSIKRPLKGEYALICHQCQRNDKGRVVWCLDCKKSGIVLRF